MEFQTKPQIALGLIDRALGNGVRVAAWTFDELYGRDGKFLDGLEEREQAFVAEVPVDFHGWVRKPQVLRKGPNKSNKRGRRKQYPRLARRRPSSEVRNLVKYSPVFREQSWQRYHIKDTEKGPAVWEVKWSSFWRKGEDGLPGRRNCLIVARNVLTGEMKYFVANRVPGEKGVTLRWLLRVAFGRWPIESCFREAKHELGMDHYQVRGWRCIHRHFFLTQVSHLFCARVRQEYDESGTQGDRLTVEQVRSATNTWLAAADLPPAKRKERYEKELNKQRYHQRRNRQSRLLIHNILTTPHTLYEMEDWLGPLDAEALGLMSQETCHIQDDRIGKSLARFYEARHKDVFFRLALRAIKVFELDCSVSAQSDRRRAMPRRRVDGIRERLGGRRVIGLGRDIGSGVVRGQEPRQGIRGAG